MHGSLTYNFGFDLKAPLQQNMESEPETPRKTGWTKNEQRSTSMFGGTVVSGQLPSLMDNDG